MWSRPISADLGYFGIPLHTVAKIYLGNISANCIKGRYKLNRCKTRGIKVAGILILATAQAVAGNGRRL